MDCTFDTKDHGAQTAIADGRLEITRTGLVTGIPADAAADPFVMIRALDEVIARAGQTHPAVANAYISRLLIRPTSGTDQVTFAVTYSSPTAAQNSGSVRWLIEDDSTVTNEIEEMDLNGQPIQTWFRAGVSPFLPGPALGSGPKGRANWLREANIATFTGQVHVQRIRRALSVHGYISGRPGEGVLLAHDCVNEKPWQGLKRGHWLCTRVASAAEGVGLLFDHRQSTFRVSARFETKAIRDWSHFLFHRNVVGKVPSEMTGPEYAAAILKIVNQPYRTDQDHSVNGFTKVGMYYVADFGAAFGF